MRRRLILVFGCGWLALAACSLNPQPLPPDEPSGDTNAHPDAGGGFAGGDAAGTPTSGLDSGSPADAGDLLEAGADGEAGDDAADDADVGADSDAADLDASSDDAGD
jgi:hypothetical protein